MDSRTWRCRPSELLGLEPGSYEAYCLDQAIGYLGTMVESELDRAGHRPSKGEKKTEAARKRIIAKYMGETEQKKQFADPALLFQ